MKFSAFREQIGLMRTCLLALGLLAMSGASVSAAELLDDRPRIAVVSAFAPEWIELQEDLTGREEHVVNGGTYLTGKLAGKDVVMFLSGVSIVNAAMTTQAALDRFVITSIVFSGIAGGVDPALDIGDVVIADQWAQYLESVFARKTDEGYAVPPFMEQEFPNFGMIVPKSVTLRRKGSTEEEKRFWFPADPVLLKAARMVASDLELSGCAEDGECLTSRPEIVVGGNGVSGPAFVDNAEFRKFVMETFEAKVLDMESAAVAHVAYSNDVPFLAVRSLSDLVAAGMAPMKWRLSCRSLRPTRPQL